MPVAGAVISTRQERAEILLAALRACPGVDIYGEDGKGNIIAVLEAASKDEMEALVRRLEAMDEVLHVGITFLAADGNSTDTGSE
ncbi:MAG: chaperone NapD [Desulfobulbaceae bacterium]|nr:chaperone NapD [Desulfobulbaceae bacterium]